MPLDLPVVERFVASEHVGAAELVAGHSAGHSGCDVAVAGVAELQLVAVAVAVAVAVDVADGGVDLELDLEVVDVELDQLGHVVVHVIVHSDEFVAGLVVGGRVD